MPMLHPEPASSADYAFEEKGDRQMRKIMVRLMFMVVPVDDGRMMTTLRIAMSSAVGAVSGNFSLCKFR
jgi:hypothetical protein